MSSIAGIKRSEYQAVEELAVPRGRQAYGSCTPVSTTLSSPQAGDTDIETPAVIYPRLPRTRSSSRRDGPWSRAAMYGVTTLLVVALVVGLSSTASNGGRNRNPHARPNGEGIQARASPQDPAGPTRSGMGGGGGHMRGSSSAQHGAQGGQSQVSPSSDPPSPAVLQAVAPVVEEGGDDEQGVDVDASGDLHPGCGTEEDTQEASEDDRPAGIIPQGDTSGSDAESVDVYEMPEMAPGASERGGVPGQHASPLVPQQPSSTPGGQPSDAMSPGSEEDEDDTEPIVGRGAVDSQVVFAHHHHHHDHHHDHKKCTQKKHSHDKKHHHHDKKHHHDDHDKKKHHDHRDKKHKHAKKGKDDEEHASVLHVDEQGRPGTATDQHLGTDWYDWTQWYHPPGTGSAGGATGGMQGPQGQPAGRGVGAGVALVHEGQRGEPDPLGRPNGTGEEGPGRGGGDTQSNQHMGGLPVNQPSGRGQESAELAREDEMDEPMGTNKDQGSESESISKRGGGAGMQAPPSERADAPRGQELARGGQQKQQAEQPQQGHLFESAGVMGKHTGGQAAGTEPAAQSSGQQGREGGQSNEAKKHAGKVYSDRDAALAAHTQAHSTMGSSGGVGQREPEGERMEARPAEQEQKQPSGMCTMNNGQGQGKQEQGAQGSGREAVLTLMKARGDVVGKAQGQEEGMGTKGQGQETHETTKSGREN